MKIYASVYGLKGDSYEHDNRTINNWGANLGYGRTYGKFTFDMGKR